MLLGTPADNQRMAPQHSALRSRRIGSKAIKALFAGALAAGLALAPSPVVAQIPSGCGTLSAVDAAPQARFPRNLVLREAPGRVRLYLKDVTQSTQATVRLTVRGRRIDVHQPGDYTCTTRGSQSLISKRLTINGRRLLRLYPRPRVRVTLMMRNGSYRTTTLSDTLGVRTAGRR